MINHRIDGEDIAETIAGNIEIVISDSDFITSDQWSPITDKISSA